ncbi:MAG: HAD hydrolase-like protein [Chloroflexi bacterium]|nr:HAD hydrolase-like protein [Chloroflexota bacterium]
MFDIIAFDADDTLWHTEIMFIETQAQFRQMLAPWADVDTVDHTLYQMELRGFADFGYGIKGFALAMVETAIALSGGQIAAQEIQRIIDFARDMRRWPVELLDGVQHVVARLAQSHQLMIITKGELIDQESKIARSGLADYFSRVEIVSDKTPEAYSALLARHGIDIGRFLMIGNSLRSDILPVLAIGGEAVYVPYRTTWAHERVADENNPGGYHEVEHIAQLPALIEELSRDQTMRRRGLHPRR